MADENDDLDHFEIATQESRAMPKYYLNKVTQKLHKAKPSSYMIVKCGRIIGESFREVDEEEF
eukprot:8211644-Karenia_brevis.AAC.1